jgi:dihydroflavonol-4-reductase
MRFLVTGATGKVGNAVTGMLTERGDEVVALVRDPERARESLGDQVELARGDVTDPDSIRAAATGIDGAFNCMGIFEQWLPDPGRFDRVNAEGTRNVVAAARDAGAGRVVHTSTFDVFEAPRGGTVSEAVVATEPKGTYYERSKQLAERVVLSEAAGGEIEVVICNPAGVIGPGPWAKEGLDSALRDALRKRLPAVPPGGMTLAYVEDVAAGHLAAFDRGRPGERYILADGFASMREIVTVAVDAAGRGRVPPRIPEWLAKGAASAGEGISRLTRHPPLIGKGALTFLLWEARADNRKAREELGVEFTPWREAVARTVRWMIESGRV